MKRAIALFALAALSAGCGSQYRSAFGHHFLDNQERDLNAVLARLPEASRDDAPENALGQPIVVGTTHSEEPDGASQIVAFRVDTGEHLWATPLDAATQPQILGDVVLTSTREQLFAHDVATGRELWRHDLPDLAYVGATRDGDTVYWSATVGALGGARRLGYVVAMDARSGDERWRHEVRGVFGEPAASGGLVFVPWERQNIAVLDGETGSEVARLRSADDVIAWAFDHPSGIYYGGRGIYRLTNRSVHGTQEEATYVRPPLGELPREPESVWPDGYVPKPGTRSARGRIRLYFNPAPPDGEQSDRAQTDRAQASGAEAIKVEGDRYYFAYYRYVFAYDLEGQLRWVRTLDQDVLNAQAMPHGLLTVGEQGHLHLLDRDSGSDLWTQDLETPLASVAIDASGLEADRESAGTPPLRQTLNALIADPDNRLVAARSYAVQQLARIDEPEVTRDLLELYQQRSMPGAVKETIREALRTRRSGEAFLMEALARRYDYLEETQAPPLEAILPALLEMELREAVPQLVAHMMDHETPDAVLPKVVAAVVQLGGEQAVPALRDFLVRYRADSEFAGPVQDDDPDEQDGEPPVQADPEARALAIAAAGIFEHGGPAGRELLSSLSEETARTHDPIATHIASLYEAEAEAERQAELARQREEQEAIAAAEREAEAALPARLTRAQIDQTFTENADSVRECVAGELERNPQLTQVRLLFILANDGQAEELTVAPSTPELVACLDERVSAIEFPRFKQRRMRASFVVSIRGSESGAEDTLPAVQPLPEDAPWWAWSQRQATQDGAVTPAATETAATETMAWWTEREPPVRAQPTEQIMVADNECPPDLPDCNASEAVRAAARAGRSEGQRSDAASRRQAAAERSEHSSSSDAEQRQERDDRASQPPSDGGAPWWAAAVSEEEDDNSGAEENRGPRSQHRPRR